MRIVFFRIPKPKQFEYQPRYWDERKEQLDNIRKRYQPNEESDPASRIRSRMDLHWRRRNERSLKRKSSVLTMLIYAAVAALLIWLFLK